MREYLSYAQFQARYVRRFLGLQHLYDPRVGFIVWRQGTGHNTELLHIRSFHPGVQGGRRLVYAMLDVLSLPSSPQTYHSIYGFTRVSNDDARAFYGALGFTLTQVQGVYRDGSALLFSAPFLDLRAAQILWTDEHGPLEPVTPYSLRRPT